MKKLPLQKKQAGFTIVELMIATMVFSVILIVVTFGVIHFSNAYYKGVNSSTTQGTTRSAMDTITQSIQFSGQPVTGTDATNSNYFCAGGKVYMFTLGKQFTGTPSSTNWGLYAAPMTASGSCQAISGPVSGGIELLGQRLRVTDVSVGSDSNNLYSVKLRVAYGDSDLMCSPTITGVSKGSCAVSAISYAPTDTTARDILCKARDSSQFCSVSTLATTVGARLAN